MRQIFFRQLKAFHHTVPVLAAGLLCASFATAPDKETHRVNTLRQVMKRITTEHFQPKALDDNFSSSIWTKYLQNQDPNKLLFRQQDIALLRSWEKQIDDELKAPSLGFFRQADSLLVIRIKEMMPLYRGLLAKPMDFSRKDSIAATIEHWPGGEKACKLAWERYLKLQVLQKMREIQAEKPALSMAAAEKEARAKVLFRQDVFYNNYVGESGTDLRFSSFMNTVVMEIDPHTNFYAPADERERDARMSHRYFGVGLELSADEGDIRVKRVLPGGSAERSGLLQANDHILSLADAGGKMKPLAGLSVSQVSQMVRGDSGSVLRMLVSRAGRESEISLTRGVILDNSNAAKSAVIERNGKNYGYIKLPDFYKDLSRPDGAQCAMDVAKAVLALKKENVAGIIIDLRGNGGGSLEEVQKMAGIFLPAGPVSQGRFKDKTTRFDMMQWKDVSYDGPLTVMVDESSASASEMFAGAMQDYGRAVIVGSPSSYGKGTMQETRAMGKMGNKQLGTPNISYGSLAITLGRFYRITGASTQLNGVTPDVVFPGKGEWNGFRERNYPTAWEPDTMAAAYFERWEHAGTLTAPIAAAKARVAQDTGFAAIGEALRWLKAHEKDVRSLSFKEFQRAAAEKAAVEQRLEAAARMTGGAVMGARVLVSAAPGSPEADRQQEWLKTLRTDRYIAHSADLVGDMAH
ncbi:carboxy terminal-processing peptidase [Chitinophaga sp. NPDC101104]|uniref:carboxy terminal-processing peptidase n=1 Tax=Chitinophaga sp. NPDC101104 TaxID=3390561 RepID=UPI003D05295C